MLAKQEKTLVSIIVRTKDRPELLKRALKSIASQTYRPLEAVIVNDGGCDLPVEELRAILSDVFFRYIRLDKNQGRASAGNIGIENAGGVYIGFLDDDDEFYFDHVSTLVNVLSNSAHRVAYTDSEIIHYEYSTEKRDFIVKDRHILFSEEFSYEKLLLSNYIPLMCLLFDAGLKQDLKFDNRFDLFEDWDLLIRLAEKYPFQHIKSVTAKYNHNLVPQITSDGTFHSLAFQGIMEKHFHRINPETLFHNWKGIVSAKELSYDFSKLQADIKVLKIFLKEKTGLIQEKERLIEQKEKTIGEKEKIITDKERIITQKHSQILDIQTSLNTIHNSLGWQALEIIRGYIERLLPVYSRRRYYYDLVIKSIKIMKNQGVKSLYSSATRKLKAKKYTGFKNIQRAGSRIQDPFLTKPVDIVIPVYNASADFSECIKSVLNTTDLNFHRLIIVDDRSTDPEIKTCLETLKGGGMGANIVILMNERNLGFAKTINNGMRFSRRDVIILNSDTITSEGWVEKMRRAACSQPGVATVTPFSNNATICSVPMFCENNHLPDGFDLKGFAAFIERISLRHYPQIPTGVGFCMYIKREVLNEVGYFDEQNFQGGYGEENDFCWKASQKGYKHVLDDATFIYHRGGASFTPEVKRAKEDEALRIIDMLHPDYIPAVQKFIHENPLREIHEYISLRISLEQEKRQPVLSGY